MALNARNSDFKLTEGMDYNNHKVDHIDLHGHSSDQNEGKISSVNCLEFVFSMLYLTASPV